MKLLSLIIVTFLFLFLNFSLPQSASGVNKNEADKTIENDSGKISENKISTITIETFKTHASPAEKSQWSWAACISMILNFYDIPSTQEEVVKKITGDIKDIPAGSLKEIAEYMNGTGITSSLKKLSVNATAYDASVFIPFKDMIDEIKEGRPFIIGIANKDKESGHVVICYGVDWYENSEGQCITDFYVYDPCSGIFCKRSSEELKDYWMGLIGIEVAFDIFNAIESGDLGMVKELFTADPNIINTENDDGERPIFYGARHGKKEIVEFLINKGANINDKDIKGSTVLHLAVSGGSKELVEFLLSKGMDINARDSKGNTPLQHAILNYVMTYDINFLESVKFLINKGANINNKNINGVTALHQVAGATGTGCVSRELLEILINKGADINAIDIDGKTALHYASGSGTPDLTTVPDNYTVEFLVNKGADINVKDNYGRTALHYSAEIGTSSQLVKFLLSKGLDINAKDKEGKTPLTIAKEHQNNDIVELLIKYGGK